MSDATAFADAAIRARAWRILLWLASVTALWLAVNWWLPALQPSGIPNVAVRLGIHVAIALGLWLALERTDLAPRQRLTIWLALMVPFTLWLAVVWGLAVNGGFQLRPGAGVPKVPLAIFMPLIVALPILLRSQRVGQVLDAMPPAWPIALQVYRVLGGGFLIAWALGNLPAVFALPAGVGDVTTGLLALPAAYYLASNAAAARNRAIAWNIFGLVDFAVAIGIGLITAPGPFQLIVPAIPSTGLGTYPSVMIPAFAVPSSILLHALSLRQLRRLAKREARPQPAPATGFSTVSASMR